MKPKVRIIEEMGEMEKLEDIKIELVKLVGVNKENESIINII